MAHSLLVESIIEVLPSPTLPNNPGKPDYSSIQETHCLLTTKAASIKISCVGVQNGHLGLVLTEMHYALVSQAPFVCPVNPGGTPTIMAWISPFDKKNII